MSSSSPTGVSETQRQVTPDLTPSRMSRGRTRTPHIPTPDFRRRYPSQSPSVRSRDRYSRLNHNRTPSRSPSSHRSRSRSRSRSSTSSRRSTNSRSEILSLPPVDTGIIEDMSTLVNPRKPAPTEKELPKTLQPLGAGQEFAVSEILSQGLAPEAKTQMRATYAAHKGFLAPPLLDPGLPQQLMLDAWPASKSSRSNYAPFTNERKMVREQEELAEWARPSIQLIEDVQLCQLDTRTKCRLVQSATDTLQYIGDKHRGLTASRRENLFKASPLAKPWIHLLEDPSKFGAWPETRDHLFGPTFCSEITKFVTQTQELRRGMDSSSSRSVTHNHHINPQIMDILQDLKLPYSYLPIKFNDISPVNFIGGRLNLFLANWFKVTTNPDIINVIRGHKINFYANPPAYRDLSRPGTSRFEFSVVKSLLSSKVIETTTTEGFVSPIFLRQKQSGLHRLILDLSEVNLDVEYRHFKMQSLDDALLLINKDDMLTKIDLTSAYDCCPIAPESRKYLQFRSNNVLYQFRGFPNGLAEAPRLFTLITKPVREVLNSLGIRHILYLDDMLLMAKNRESSLNATSLAIQLFTNLGFVINTAKSVVAPTTHLEFLGFQINTEELTLSLSDKKVEKVTTACKLLKSCQTVTKRQLAKMVGLLVSITPVIDMGPLHYRGLQRLLNSVQEGWESQTLMTEDVKRDLTWWLINIRPQNSASFVQKIPEITLTTDASNTGWGAVMGNQTAQDYWTTEESLYQINILELIAIKHGMMSLLKDTHNKCLLIKSDSTVALSYIRKKGGTKCKIMTELATQIWEFAKQRSITLSTQHIPGKHNLHADYLSRLPRDLSDWKLNPAVWREINSLRGPLHLDLFARAWNKQTTLFVTWRGHPAASGTDAFSIPWPKLGGYAFPPFGLISKTLRKCSLDKCTLVLIAPVWRTSPWYSNLIQMICDHPVLLPQSLNLLVDRSHTSHPLLVSGNLSLAAWTVSGNICKVKEFQQELLKSFTTSRNPPLEEHMTLLGKDGYCGIINGIPIRFLHISQTS